MAGEDFLIVAGLDLSKVESKLASFYQYQAQLEAKAAASSAKAQTRVTNLPNAVASRIANPVVPKIGGAVKTELAQIKAVKDTTAELVALQIKSLELKAKAAGINPGYSGNNPAKLAQVSALQAEIANLKAGAAASIRSSLKNSNIEIPGSLNAQVANAIKGQLAALEAIKTPVGLTARANERLPLLGIAKPATTKTFSTVASDNATANAAKIKAIEDAKVAAAQADAQAEAARRAEEGAKREALFAKRIAADKKIVAILEKKAADEAKAAADARPLYGPGRAEFKASQTERTYATNSAYKEKAARERAAKAAARAQEKEAALLARQEAERLKAIRDEEAQRLSAQRKAQRERPTKIARAKAQLALDNRNQAAIDAAQAAGTPLTDKEISQQRRVPSRKEVDAARRGGTVRSQAEADADAAKQAELAQQALLKEVEFSNSLGAATGSMIALAKFVDELGLGIKVGSAEFYNSMAFLQASIDAAGAEFAGLVSQTSLANPDIAFRRGLGDANLVAGEAEAKALRAGIINANPQLAAQLAAAEARYIELRLEQIVAYERELLASGKSAVVTTELTTLKAELAAQLLRTQAGDTLYLSATNEATLARKSLAALEAQRLVAPGSIGEASQAGATVTASKAELKAAEQLLLEAYPGYIESIVRVTASNLRQAAAADAIITGDAAALEAIVAASTANLNKARAANELALTDTANVEASILAKNVTTRRATAENQLTLIFQNLIADEAAGRITKAELNLAIEREIAATNKSAALTNESNLVKAREKAKRIQLDVANGNELALQLKANSDELKRQLAPSGAVGGFRATENAGGRDVGAFLGGGLATTLKFAIPSALLFGAFAGIKDALKDSEELAITFTKLDSQLSGLDNEDRLANLKKQIFEVSSETGIAAAEIGDLALQIQGAFGDLKFDPNKLNDGGLKGSDGIIRYGDEVVAKQIDAAGKLSVVTGIAQKELVDGLTAASFAFGTSADRIGDVSAKLEVSTGVKAKETISFLGDIGPVAEAAKFSLEEFAAIAAIAQKRSGATGSVLAEQFGRIIPAISKNSKDFFNIANKNKKVFESLDGGDGFNNFIKSIQKADTKGIFEALAGSFDRLDKGSQEFIIQLIGGRREANALLSVFNDTEGLDKATKAAEDSAGVLDDRFTALQKRITVIFAKLRTEFTKLAKVFIDSGFGKAAGLTLKELEVILKVANGIFSIFTKLDEVTGGLASNLAAVVIQMKILTTITKALIGEQALAAVTALPAGASLGTRLSTAVPALAGLTNRGQGGGFFPNSRAAVRASLITSNFGPGNIKADSFSNAALAKSAGPGAALKAGGKGLFTAVGGATGVGFLAAAGALAVYETISSKLESDRLAIRKLKDKLSSEAEAGRTSAQFLKDAKELKRKQSGWDKFWVAIAGEATDEELAIAKAAQVRPDRKKAVDALRDAATGDLNIDALNAAIFTTSNKDYQDTFREYFGASGATQVRLDKNLTKRERASLQDFGKNLFDSLGLKEGETIPQPILDIITKSNNIAGDIANLDSDGNKRIEEMKANIAKALQANPDLKNTFGNVGDPIKNLQKSTSETILGDIELAKDFFTRKRISLKTYTDTLKATLRQLESKENKTEQEEKAIIEFRQNITDAFATILNQQERDLEIFKLLGASDEEVNKREADNALANLQNVNFNDPELRRKAALSLLENTRKYYENLVKNTDDLALAQKLLNEGFEIPPEARQALQKSIIEDSGLFQDLADKVRGLNKSDKTKGILGKGPGGLLDKVLKDFFDDGIVSSETITYLNDKQSKLQEKLQEKNLSDVDKENIKATLQFIGELLRLTPEGTKGRPSGKVDDNNKPIGGKTPDQKAFDQDIIAKQAKLAEENAKQAADDAEKLTDSRLNLAKAQAAGNAKAIAALNKASAVAKLQAAQAITDSKEREIAINDALAAGVQADLEMADAIAAENQARYDLVKAKRSDAGDTVGAANAGVAGAAAALAAARAKDPTGVEALGAEAALISAQREASDAQKAVRDSAKALARFVAANEDPLKEAQYDLDAAKEEYAAARGTLAKNQAALAVKQAEREVRNQLRAIRDSLFSLFKAIVAGDDPVKQAEFDLNVAKQLQSDARGTAAEADAALRTLDAEKALRDAMQSARLSVFNLRKAQLDSMGDDIGVANIGVKEARQQLADAISNKAGAAAINAARANVISAEKTAKDVIFQNKLDENQYLLDTGKQTKSEYIKYLQGLQATLAPGSKQFKDLERTLYNLKNDIGSDLKNNLPTTLALPTLYEVRRLNQSGPQGYQDSRTQASIVTTNNNQTITINAQGANAEQVAVEVGKVLGLGRNGTTPGRF